MLPKYSPDELDLVDCSLESNPVIMSIASMDNSSSPEGHSISANDAILTKITTKGFSEL